jgi:hypothetical protein
MGTRDHLARRNSTTETKFDFFLMGRRSVAAFAREVAGVLTEKGDKAPDEHRGGNARSGREFARWVILCTSECEGSPLQPQGIHQPEAKRA